jgi:hypothetical protein
MVGKSQYIGLRQFFLWLRINHDVRIIVITILKKVFVTEKIGYL